LDDVTMRERLANRRSSLFFCIEAMKLRFSVSASRYPDGRLAEVFMDNHKGGSDVGTLVRDSAIILSFALQHGADANAIRRALCRDSQGRPLGPMAVALDLLVDGG
jgi:hypothetical protein